MRPKLYELVRKDEKPQFQTSIEDKNSSDEIEEEEQSELGLENKYKHYKVMTWTFNSRFQWMFILTILFDIGLFFSQFAESKCSMLTLIVANY